MIRERISKLNLMKHLVGYLPNKDIWLTFLLVHLSVASLGTEKL